MKPVPMTGNQNMPNFEKDPLYWVSEKDYPSF